MNDTAASGPGPSRIKPALSRVIIAAAVLVAALVLGPRLFFRPFIAPSASMEPALVRGDYFVVRFTRDLAPGDVATFGTGERRRVAYMKRLVAVGGDRVQMFRGDLRINGRRVDRADAGPAPEGVCWNGEPGRTLRETLPNGRSYLTYDCGASELDDTPPFVVPAGHYFFMGDNRDNSADSRIAAGLGGIGFVPREAVIGKAERIVLSWNNGASRYKPWTWFDVRAERTFQPVR
jgi:signal peptidase I